MKNKLEILGLVAGFIFIICFTIVNIIYEIYLQRVMVVETTGVVTRTIIGRLTDTAFAVHYVNGEWHEGRLRNNWTVNMMAGQQIRIYYDSANPSQMRTDNSTFLVLTMFAAVLGALFFGVCNMKARLIEASYLNDEAIFLERLENLPQKEAEAEIALALDKIECERNAESIFKEPYFLFLGTIVVLFLLSVLFD